MRKIIITISLLFVMFSLNAYPKFIMLDYKCGNTPEYTAQFVELDKTKKISEEHIKYLGYLKGGTWLIEFDDRQKVYCSFLPGNMIFGGYVKQLLIDYKEENR